jgi:hypothetical protein
VGEVRGDERVGIRIKLERSGGGWFIRVNGESRGWGVGRDLRVEVSDGHRVILETGTRDVHRFAFKGRTVRALSEVRLRIVVVRAEYARAIRP